MKNKNDMLPWIILGVTAIVTTMGVSSHINILKTFLPGVEGFSAYPVWDYGQWSWGYGTAAGYDKNKKPVGTITREKAMQDTLKVLDDHYRYLKPRLKKNINAKQWAALLSFSYNLGAGTAAKIVDTINTKTAADVVARMKLYVKAGGVTLPGLVARRKKETDLYLS